MPVSVTHLLDDLEARLGEAKAELTTLRDENRRLKHRLAQAPTAQEPPAPAEAAPSEAEGDKEAAPAAVEAEPPHEAAKPEAPSPQALLKQWYVRYPQAFLSAHTRPLKVGIHEDLARHEPWSSKLIRRALAHYVNLPRYVKALREGTPRIDLDGNPAGAVDATAAQAALEKRRRQEGSKGSAEKKNAGKPRRPEKPKAAKPSTPAGKVKGGENPQIEETPQQPPQSMEDKLASLQHRFGGKE